MNAKEDRVRTLIAEQAAEWFVANREGLDAQQRGIFAAWLKTSRVHVEEYLAVASIDRDLRKAAADPAVSLESLIAEARAQDDSAPRFIRPDWVTGPRRPSLRPWLAVAAAALAVVSLTFLLWHSHPAAPALVSGVPAAISLQTRHGEQLIRRLADKSVLHLDTDTDLTVRYDRTQRTVVIHRGRAAFEVVHDPARKFVVLAGAAQVIDVGTNFDVYLEGSSTLVTVLEGRVTVGPSHVPLLGHEPGAVQNGTPMPEQSLAGSTPDSASPSAVEVVAGQQIRVSQGVWPAQAAPVDAQRATAWLRRQIVFEHEPLERVAAEFNRYSQTPIEIASPALRSLEVSGVFTADDTESFVAFLRSLEGVQVEVSATRIRVSQK